MPGRWDRPGFYEYCFRHPPPRWTLTEPPRPVAVDPRWGESCHLMTVRWP
ncbi:hypothetical protein ATKI12_0854 [Kitasatospora sp. Ki12]